MHNIETDILFHVFRNDSQTWERRNLSWEQMVDYICHKISYVGCCDGDTYPSIDWVYGPARFVEGLGYVSGHYQRKVYESRVYNVVDSYGRVVQYDVLKEAVEKYNDEEPERQKRRYSNWSWWRKYHFEFRREPVPCTGHSGRNTHYYRHVPARLATFKKLEDYPEFCIGYRLVLDSIRCMWWDDYPPRSVQRSWKKQGKRRHQWE